jgi:hypothetical protein
MTTLVEAFVAAITNGGAAPVGGIWPVVNTKEPPVYPYAVYQRVLSQENVSLGGSSNLQQTRLQLDVYARTYSEALLAVNAIDAALFADPLTVIALTAQDLPDFETRAYRVVREYSVWSTLP